MNKIKLHIILNEQSKFLHVNANRRLLDILREDFKLTGTKEGCSIGECGACTVIMNGRAVNSCLVLAGQVNEAKIITIEHHKINNTFFHVTFGSQSLLKPTSDQTSSDAK